jgi:hypothetical protein
MLIHGNRKNSNPQVGLLYRQSEEDKHCKNDSIDVQATKPHILADTSIPANLVSV